MRIELHEANDTKALGGTPELWMRVLSDTLTDLPGVVGALDPEQREVFAGYEPTPLRYRMAWDENNEHGFQFEDWWIFGKRNEG